MQVPWNTRSLLAFTALESIAMTSFAMIAGMLPLAVGMGELSKVRAGMNVVRSAG